MSLKHEFPSEPLHNYVKQHTMLVGLNLGDGLKRSPAVREIETTGDGPV